jgi:hypothetical protein
LRFAGSILTFPTANGLERIEAGDPQSHGVARRHPQLLRLASLRDFTMEGRQAALLLVQETLLQQLADDAFDRFRQASLAFAAARLPRSQASDQPRALPGAADQDIHLLPGQARA